MAGEDGWGRRPRRTVAVILVLCALVQSLTCFSLRGLSQNVKQDQVVNEAAVMEVKTGSILFNGKELDSQSGSASAAATGNDGLLNIDLDQSNDTEMFEQMSQQEEAMAKEAAWRCLKPSLHCGENKMKLKAIGPGAADLQLDMGNAHPLPLIQVPETCGYSMKQNALGLVLVVPYDGCNVIQENGNYVLPMQWLETPVKFTCPMLPSSATAPALTTPAQQPWKLPLPHGPWSLNRRKRHTNQPLSIYDPSHPYYLSLLYYYYMYMMTLAPTPGTTTTAKPDPTITTEPSTETPSQMKPPVYPAYMYYPYYPYYYPYYHLPNVPVMTTKPPATTTAQSTTGSATSGMTAQMTTTASASTTTASASTTKAPQKTQFPYYPPYFPYFPYYPPAGQQFPGTPNISDLYYYHIIQHYYGKPPYPHVPNSPLQTTLPPTATTKPGGPSTTTKPVDTAPTTKPMESSPTAEPTTTSAPTAPTTTKVCSHTTRPSSNNYPGPMSPFVPYYNQPFVPYVAYKNKAGKLLDDQKYMPLAGYKSGLQARAHPPPPPHPGFHYWQPVPWFPQSTGKDNLQFDWTNLQPKH